MNPTTQTGELESVLVVDDDPVSISILVECLRDRYRVQIATSGEEALRIVASDSPPDLVTLDIVMPGIDGFGTCRRIRQLPHGRDIPIFFVTSLTAENDEAAGFACGAVDYIQKPLSPPLVQARVAAHLELRRARLELAHRNQLLLEKARLQAEVDRLTQHDLKNGLSIVLSEPGKLLKDPGLTEAQIRSLERITQAAQKMRDVMSRSEGLMTLEAGRLAAHRSVRLVPLVNEVLAAHRGASQAKLLVWDAPRLDSDPIEVAGDELLLYSLLSNLTKNAIEAAPAGSVLHLLAWTSSQQEGCLTLRNEGRSGIGDYTAALIAQAHGGALEAKVIAEQETEVHLKLPLFLAAR